MKFEKNVRIYNNNIKAFREFESIVNKTFSFSNETGSRTVKKILATYTVEKTRISCFSFLYIGICIFLFIPFLIYLTSKFVFTKSTIPKNLNYDILFENWGKNKKDNNSYFEKFYRKIFQNMPNAKIGILESNIFEKSSPLDFENIEIIRRGLFLPRNIVGRVLKYCLKYFFKIIYLSLKYKINFLLIFLHIFRQYSYHTLTVQNINKVKYLISAYDNGYTPLLYDVYKKNGIDNVFLIQNGIRIDLSISGYYISCDKFFTLSKIMKNGYLGLKVNDEIVNVGSLKLFNNIYKLKEKAVFGTYDIVFLEQSGPDNTSAEGTDKFHLRKNSMLALKYLSTFSNKHKNMKILYQKKPTIVRGKGYDYFIDERDKILNTSNILLHEKNDYNSYQALLEGKVIVYTHTTLGLEAISLGKRVLCCNFVNLDFVLSQDDEIGVLIDCDYSKFENKLIRLLSNKGNELVDEYYNEKMNQFGKVSNNPFLDIILRINI